MRQALFLLLKFFWIPGSFFWVPGLVAWGLFEFNHISLRDIIEFSLKYKDLIQFILTIAQIIALATGITGLVYLIRQVSANQVQAKYAKATGDQQLASLKLSLIKIKLETLLRGSSLPLSNQALPFAHSGKYDADEIIKQKELICRQLSQGSEDANQQRRIKELVDRWFQLEAEIENQPSPD